MANDLNPINFAPGWISAAVDIVRLLVSIVKFFINQYQFEDKLKEFNKSKEELKRFRESTETTMRIQLRTPGKVERKDVRNWLDAAGVEISKDQSVENLVQQKGILSLFYRTGILETKTADLNRTFESGDRILQVPWLVDDDASLKTLTERKKELEVELRDVEERLSSQLVPGKIATVKVQLWLGKVRETVTGAKAIEDEIRSARVPHDPTLPNRVEEKIREMEELLRGGALLRESLVVDDCKNVLDANMNTFTERKKKLEDQIRDVEGRLSSQLVPGKIEREKVRLWQGKVRDITGQTASDIETKFSDVSVPHGVDFSNLVKEKILEMEDLLRRGDLLQGILVVDDCKDILDENMKMFTERKKKLGVELQDVEERLSLQLVPGKIEREKVRLWRGKVKDITGETATDIETKFSNVSVPRGDDFSNLVEEKVREMEELLRGGTLPGNCLVSEGPTPELQGSDAAKEEILKLLKGNQTTKIGVWGMGGVGKTKIMKNVYDQLLKEAEAEEVEEAEEPKEPETEEADEVEEAEADEVEEPERTPKFKVIWVTVSLTVDVYRIQQEIASSLQKDEILPNHQGGHLRAAAISKMLEEHKPYVLILDDVWESFELQEVGIPEIFDGGSKLVLTTRSEEVARIIGCKRFKVNTLKWEESLKLFKDIAGAEALSDDGGATEALEEIVRECGGLPLAIKTVAASMKGISDPRLWRAALNQLKQGSRNVAGAEKDPFRVLKFSYYWLGNPRIQHCFLHCALYPEDAMILTEDLIDYWIDEELIGVMGTWQEMKDEGHDILNKLVENCLLERVKDKSGSNCVKMHDLMRDMALDITRSSSSRFLVKAGVGLRELPEEHEWKEDLLKVSLMANYIQDIPSSMPSPKCPTLTTLLLSNNNLSTIRENFFEHMPELKVLDLSYNEKLRSLPKSVSKLVKLTTLLLRRCESLKEVPSLSKLTVLEKLDLYGAGCEEVPHGLEMLRNLKYLDIGRGLQRDHRSHEEVSAGWENFVSEILPTLSKLQHLGLSPKVPVEGRQLEFLIKLESFYGSVRTWSDMCILFNSGRQSLYRYNISVGDLSRTVSYELKSICCFETEICGVPGLTSIPSDVQRLAIRSCTGVRSLNFTSGFVGLQECEIWSCREMEYVFSELKQVKKLKRLTLRHLETFKGLLDSAAASTSAEGIRAKLEKLELDDLPMLRSISSLTVASVFDCLKELRISGCPNLNGYIFGGQFKFSSLHSLEVLKLVGLRSLQSVFHEEESDAPSGTETISFPLKVLQVEDCPNLKKIFPSAVQVGSFQNLERIEVKRCDELVEIMAAVSSETEADRSNPILPELEHLSLIELPVLKRICSAFVVPDSMWVPDIEDCPQLDRWPFRLLRGFSFKGGRNVRLTKTQNFPGLRRTRP